MSKSRLFACAALALASLSPPLAAAAAPAATPAIRTAPWGFDVEGQDRSVRPGDDFFQFANGGFLDKTEIPADRSRYGIDYILTDLGEQRLRDILEHPDTTGAAAEEARKTHALYTAFMDEARVNALGARPMTAELSAIKAAATRQDLARLMGGVGTFQDSLFNIGMEQDAKNPDRYAVYIYQGGLGLPDRDYYLQPTFAAKKTAYQAYVARMLKLVGWPDADANAAAILAYETKLAQASWSRVERRDPDKTYNPMTVAQLEKAAPAFPWRTFLGAAELGGVSRVIVSENTAAPKLAAIYAETPVPVLKAWAAFHLADNAAPYLSDTFDQARFDFRGKALTGQPEQRARWKRAVALDNSAMGEAVGQVYVAKYFPPEAKAKIAALVENLRVAMGQRIDRLDWMSPETKAKAHAKLKTMVVKVGYPDKWRDYSKLTVSADDLYGDVQRANAFEWRRQAARLNQPVDKAEWGMTPQTLNAYYNPASNEIVFPAAQLQSPYFDVSFDNAANYGAIGGVIGHEMTHGFDDEGRKFAADGSLTNWWTAEDGRKFEARADVLGKQFDTYEPFPGAHVNGKLTMGENIGDLGGVLVALDAYHNSLGGKPAPVIDGLTGEQRFFLAYAQSWREKAREDTVRQQVVSDPHSPYEYRVNGVVRNVDAWYEAFGVKPGDKLYVAPDQRARIW